MTQLKILYRPLLIHTLDQGKPCFFKTISVHYSRKSISTINFRVILTTKNRMFPIA